ncbi:MAG: DotU family type IV/VI secretion system protein [Thermodesulfobacteriota bacterium]|nr:DotU family type IV/VI secretion system protein [Thermodesulfobacteriota bacterium]
MKFTIIDCVTELFAYTYYLVEKLSSSQIDFDQVKDNYTGLIDQARVCGKSAGIPQKKIDKALFPVFAWIDESLLETSWDHKQEWIKNSLQKVYFNTTNAGEIFFKNLEKLTEDEKEIQEVYQYSLSSGFKGNMYQSFSQEQLKNYKENTLKKIKKDEELQVPEILFPEAGNSIFSQRLKRKKWKGLAGLSYMFVLLPILLFVALFYFFDKTLMDMIRASGVFI